jgi:putative DNA primase/helicase
LFFLHGKGKNGKSTFVTTLETILADHATSITADMLTVDQKKGIPTEVCDLFGVRMAVTTETEDNTRFAESLLKLLCGGTDKIKGRRLYQNPFQFDATFKLWIAGNHRPRIRGQDDAIWDRVKLIPFNRRFEKPDEKLPAKLAAEADGILAWCVRGCLDWQAKGLGEPDEVKAATKGYRKENDVLGHFIEWCCVVGSSFKVRAGDLFAAYKRWAEASGEFVMSNTKFGTAMAERFRKETSNGIWYVGVGLKGSGEDKF